MHHPTQNQSQPQIPRKPPQPRLQQIKLQPKDLISKNIKYFLK